MNKDTLYISYTRKKLKLNYHDIFLLDEIRMNLSIVNDKAKYSKHGSDIYTPISPTGLFDVGLYHEVIKQALKTKPSLRIEISDDAKRLITPISFKKNEIKYFHNNDFEERGYQKKSIDLALKNGRGLIELPTGSGKSYVIYSLMMNLLNKPNKVQNILLLVPGIQLVKQFYQDCIEYGCNENLLQMWSGFNSELNVNPIIISNRQYLEKHSDQLPRIDAIIIDECQQIGEEKNNVTKYVSGLDTHIRFGFSGTIPTKERVRWNLIGLIGPLLDRKSVV